jgi:hypothetical protein
VAAVQTPGKVDGFSFAAGLTHCSDDTNNIKHDERMGMNFDEQKKAA